MRSWSGPRCCTNSERFDDAGRRPDKSVQSEAATRHGRASSSYATGRYGSPVLSKWSESRVSMSVSRSFRSSTRSKCAPSISSAAGCEFVRYSFSAGSL